MGDTKSGFSWFYPSDGLDEGDSLLQWECDIGPDDTVIDLYLASYERRCIAKHARIDWNKPVGQVYNLIRGTNPAPGAWTTLNGDTVKIFNCSRVPGDGISSKVYDVSEDGVTIQCIGGRIKIERVNAGDGKVPAADWAASVGLEVKMGLGT